MNRITAALVLIALSADVLASQCDAHFPFDGTLVDATGNGYDGMMIAESGDPGPPRFVQGRYGQALHIDGSSAMRAFLDLQHETCPQITITAWFQWPSFEFDAAQYLWSTGARGGIPAVRANKSTLTLYGQANGLSQKNAIRDGTTWYFVAATFDYSANTYTLHWRNRQQSGTLGENPYDAEDSFWIGTRSDDMRGTARNLVVDDVRVYGRVLDLDEIRDVSRNALAHGVSSSPRGTRLRTTMAETAF